MQVMESGEDYLEAILILQKRNGVVRSVEIAAELKVTKASVSVAMKNLKKGGYIQMGENHEITLTPEGRKLAETMYERLYCFQNYSRAWALTMKLHCVTPPYGTRNKRPRALRRSNSTC